MCVHAGWGSKKLCFLSLNLVKILATFEIVVLCNILPKSNQTDQNMQVFAVLLAQYLLGFFPKTFNVIFVLYKGYYSIKDNVTLVKLSIQNDKNYSSSFWMFFCCTRKVQVFISVSTMLQLRQLK